jgi:hypothetical protein
MRSFACLKHSSRAGFSAKYSVYGSLGTLRMASTGSGILEAERRNRLPLVILVVPRSGSAQELPGNKPEHRRVLGMPPSRT